MKGSADPETMAPLGLTVYAHACGWTLARAHARSGDPVAIAAYLGKSDRFDGAITEFSERYAEQNELDYEAFMARFAPDDSRRMKASDPTAEPSAPMERTGSAR